MRNFEIIAVTPSSFAESVSDPSIAVAAARAGGTGIIDLEFVQPADLVASVNVLQSVGGNCGIKCGVGQIKQLQPVLQALQPADYPGQRVVLLSLTGISQEAELLAAIKRLHKQGFQVVVETVTIEEALSAERCGSDAAIAKGHEAGGRIGEETAFVLLQRCLRAIKIPVWSQGGIGLHTAAACYAAGAAGVVLDSQLLLTRESPLPPEVCAKIARMDGSETLCLGDMARGGYRVFAKSAMKTGSDEMLAGTLSLPDIQAAVSAVRPGDRLWLMGQDAAFAAPLALRFTSVAGIIQGLFQSVQEHLRQAGESRPLAEGSALAAAHSTRFPIVQGAMTRVSDTADFALSVAEGGGLPFLALALMRQSEVQKLLAETAGKLKSLPWGVGILGFVPEQLRKEQLQVIGEYKPPFALIAGGRPDQARVLEDMGIATYLHVPSALLLKSFVEMGSRRFIFEGRECGGHVGPRSSFVLWETMIEALLASIGPRDDAKSYSVLFAGGVHDHLSSAMVAAMAAPLAARGVKVGVLLGTAYLFTREAVATGAIVEKFQQAALACQDTVLLETGPGHSIRCIASPYRETFDSHRRKLEEQKKGRDEIRQELELMNLGRLRLASKGLVREGKDNDGLKVIDSQRQWSEGMYMIGQVAALHDQVMTVAQLHEDVSVAGTNYIQQFLSQDLPVPVADSQQQDKPEGIAIVGMSCLFPKASNLEGYWQNILNKVDAITEIPADRFDWRNYYDKDPLARDRISSKWGGFLEPIAFNPTDYGIPPNSLASIDPMQMMILEATRAALADAGYSQRPFPRQRTSIVLANAGHGPITAFYNLRSMLGWKLADLPDEQKKRLEDVLPEWTEDSFPGYLSNVTAGRVANRFDLGGINFCVDAACASSLAALYVAVNELRSKTSDVVLLAATDTHNQPGDYLSFSKTHALSPSGRCRTFDATADGIVISEGVAIVVLKRLADAERDGDKIYAVVRGVGGSSDGKDLSLTAPRPEGQILALERAYANAGISPATVQLIEAHGTGTVAGDKAEIAALKRVFSRAGAGKRFCAVGSVKSNIGHTKCAAGLASLIKVAKSLHHKILPPTIGVETPNPNCDFENSPFYINSELRPWVHQGNEGPRRAGVSAFGFGGTNFHAVLEEYVTPAESVRCQSARNWPSELFVFQGSSSAELLKTLGACEETIRRASAKPQELSLSWLAYNNYLRYADNNGNQGQCLSIVAASVDELKEKLVRAKANLKEDKPEWKDPSGIYFSRLPVDSQAKLALLFPGQGSQHINMGRDLALYFPEARATFEQADRLLQGEFEKPLSSYIFPPPVFSQGESDRQQQELTDTSVAQPAVGVADVAALNVLKSFGLAPDMVAGHSYGEYVALYAAGALGFEDFLIASSRRGRILSGTNKGQPGAMAAVSADVAAVEALLPKLGGITLANINAPNQCIISGLQAAIDKAVDALRQEGFHARPIAVSAAFHSPHMQPATEELHSALQDIRFSRPQIDVYSNTDCRPYAGQPEDIRDRLCEHLVKPVQFMRQITAMYESGAKVFLECGPAAVLTNLVGSILTDRPHLAIALDRPGRHGISQLQHLLAQLIVRGIVVDLSLLYRYRFRAADECLRAEELPEAGRDKRKTLSYMVDAARVWRAEPAAADNSIKSAVAAAAPEATVSMPAVTSPGAVGLVKTAGAHAIMAPVAVTTGNHNNGKQEALGLSNTTQRSISGSALSPARDNGAQTSASVPAEAAALGSNGKGSAAGKAVVGRPGIDQVVMQYQRTMLEMTNNFLQSQQNVMLAYLQAVSINGNGTAQGPEMMSPDSLRLPPQFAPLAVPQTLVSGNGNHQPQPVNGMAPEQQGILQPAGQAPVGQMQTEESLAQLTPSGRPTENNPAPAQETLPADADYLVEQFLEIVSQRTGYPPEMLDPTLDLEADLGIDSIKRVEILSSFRKILPEQRLKELEGGVEKLAATKTLQGIIDWIRSNEAGSHAGATGGAADTSDSLLVNHLPAPDAGSTQTTPAASKGKVSRGVISVIDLPELTAGSLPHSGTTIVVADEGGVWQQVIQQLNSCGLSAAVVSNGQSISKEGDAYTADLGDYQQVKQVVELIKSNCGSPSGLIYLLGLDPNPEHTVGYATKTLFYLAKALGAELKDGTAECFVLSATRLGGDFGAGKAGIIEAQQAGTVGVIKSLAREWPGVFCKAVDFASTVSQKQIADCLIKELAAGKDVVEVGYLEDRRIGLEVVAAPISPAPAPGVKLDSSSVILITGGARGITAQVALELAQRYQPNLILVGRQLRPPGAEDTHTAGLQSVRELKAAIMDKLRSQGQAVSVAAVEAIYQQLMREREIRSNIAQMERYGATVHYHCLDVRDEGGLTALVNGIYETFGRIDGVIHGAGVIEDAWIQDKKPESFNCVFDTKVLPALTLSRCLKWDTVQFVYLFSSVVGRTGNAGQSDYVAGNEVLNKLAVSLSGQAAGRVASLMWGPWNGGMAQPELESIFASHGWSMIEPVDGRRSFLEELTSGDRGTAEVLLVGQLDKADLGQPAVAKDKSGSGGKVIGARLQASLVHKNGDGTAEYTLVLDPTEDIYLQDHCFDGVPVLPMAMALELMVEAASDAYPQWQVIGVSDLDIPSGIMIDGGKKEIQVVFQESKRSDDRVELAASIKTGEKVRFRARVELALAGTISKPESAAPEEILAEVEPLPTVPDVYRRWLFHGPIFQGIASLEAMGRNGIRGTVLPSDPAVCLKSPGSCAWVIDPVLLDSSMQLAGIWARHFLDITVLPSGFSRLRLLSPLTGDVFTAQVNVPDNLHEGELICNLVIYSDGKPALLIEGLAGIGSKSFNRFAGQALELGSVR